MKALLWKDFRLCRVPLIGAGVLLVAPYVLGSYWLFKSTAHGDELVGILTSLGAVAWVSMLISCATLAGSIFAAERQDRSADFLAMLPVTRARIVRSKLIVTLLLVAVLNIVGALLAGIPAYVEYTRLFRENATTKGFLSTSSISQFLVVIGSLTVCVFGLSWLCSTFLRSAAIATAIGAGLSIGKLALAVMITEELHIDGRESVIVMSAFVAALGAAALCAGTVYALRRRLP